MRRKNFIFITAILAALMLLAISGAAISQEQGNGEEGSVNAFRANRVIGSRVFNFEGQELGTIKDIVFDIDNGQVLYAIMDFCKFLCIEGKLFPVPWDSLSALPAEGVFYLDMSEEELANAPRYNMDEMPDMGTKHWGTNVFKFYSPSGNYGPFGYVYGYGRGLYTGTGQPDPMLKHFKADSMRTITGKVIKIDQVVPEMNVSSQTQIRLIMLTEDKKPLPVYLAPQWYLARSERGLPFKTGDEITVEGSWITTETSPFLIATSIKAGDQTVQLREKDGTPVWSGWRRNK